MFLSVLKEKETKKKSILIVCSKCNGKGKVGIIFKKTCKECNGSGEKK